MHHSKIAGALLLGVSFAAGAGAPLKPVAFRAEARVEVDAEGKLLNVEASQDLPEGVRKFVEQRVAGWKFERQVRPGETGTAATWVSLGACAVPKEDGTYALGLAFDGHGPRFSGGGRWRPSGDLAMLAGRYQIDALATMNFLVHADGTADFESIEGLDDPRARKSIGSVLKGWIGSMRFDPEEVGGKPVATRSSIGIEFVSGRKTTRPTRADLLEKAMTSPECQQAGYTPDALRSVAKDSVMSIEPSI